MASLGSGINTIDKDDQQYHHYNCHNPSKSTASSPTSEGIHEFVDKLFPKCRTRSQQNQVSMTTTPCCSTSSTTTSSVSSSPVTLSPSSSSPGRRIQWIGNIPIASYDGSPRRYGKQYLREKTTTTRDSLSSSPDSPPHHPPPPPPSDQAIQLETMHKINIHGNNKDDSMSDIKGRKTETDGSHCLTSSWVSTTGDVIHPLFLSANPYLSLRNLHSSSSFASALASCLDNNKQQGTGNEEVLKSSDTETDQQEGRTGRGRMNNKSMNISGKNGMERHEPQECSSFSSSLETSITVSATTTTAGRFTAASLASSIPLILPSSLSIYSPSSMMSGHARQPRSTHFHHNQQSQHHSVLNSPPPSPPSVSTSNSISSQITIPAASPLLPSPLSSSNHPVSHNQASSSSFHSSVDQLYPSRQPQQQEADKLQGITETPPPLPTTPMPSSLQLNQQSKSCSASSFLPPHHHQMRASSSTGGQRNHLHHHHNHNHHHQQKQHSSLMESSNNNSLMHTKNSRTQQNNHHHRSHHNTSRYTSTGVTGGETGDRHHHNSSSQVFSSFSDEGEDEEHDDREGDDEDEEEEDADDVVQRYRESKAAELKQLQHSSQEQGTLSTVTSEERNPLLLNSPPSSSIQSRQERLSSQLIPHSPPSLSKFAPSSLHHQHSHHPDDSGRDHDSPILSSSNSPLHLTHSMSSSSERLKNSFLHPPPLLLSSSGADNGVNDHSPSTSSCHINEGNEEEDETTATTVAASTTTTVTDAGDIDSRHHRSGRQSSSSSQLHHQHSSSSPSSSHSSLNHSSHHHHSQHHLSSPSQSHRQNTLSSSPSAENGGINNKKHNNNNNSTATPTNSSHSHHHHKNSNSHQSNTPREVLIEGVLFRARYLGSTQLICEGQPTKATRMIQAEEAVSRIKSLAPDDPSVTPSTEVDLFISTEKIMVLNTDLKEIMMDHSLRTISYIADIGDLLVLMARRRVVTPSNGSDCETSVGKDISSGGHHQHHLPSDTTSTTGNSFSNNSNSVHNNNCTPSSSNNHISSSPSSSSTALSTSATSSVSKQRVPKMICHVFESEEAQFIAQSIGQAFQVAYMEFLKANGIEDSSFVKEMDYQEVLNSQEIFGDELEMFAKKDKQKEVIVPKGKGEILGVVIVESGWGSMLPTVVIANMAQGSPALRCGHLNIGDQIIAINGISLVGLPLSTCQNYIKNTRNQTAIKLTVVPCPPVVEVKIKRPDTKYQLGFSVQNGVICSLLRGGIAERGGVRVGHRIIEINGQSVVAVPHERIVNLLATSVGQISMRTMPTSMFRLLTGQEAPVFI